MEEEAAVDSVDDAVAQVDNWVCSSDTSSTAGFDCIHAQDNLADENSVFEAAVDSVLAVVVSDDSNRSFAGLWNYTTMTVCCTRIHYLSRASACLALNCNCLMNTSGDSLSIFVLPKWGMSENMLHLSGGLRCIGCCLSLLVLHSALLSCANDNHS